jgi:hypothetical protein
MNMHAGGSGAVLLLWAGLAAPETPAIQWVAAPPQMIQGTRFVAPEWNVSVEAPAGPWSWFYTPELNGPRLIQSRSVACRSHDPNVQFVVSAFEGHHGAVDRDEAEAVARGAAQRFVREGWTAEVVSTTPDSAPLPGSYRYVVRGSRADATAFVYGYLAAKGRLFVLQHGTARENEPPEFRRFVESYRFVGNPVQDPVDGFSNLILTITCALTLLLGGIGWLVNRLAGRVVVNLWYAALATLLAVAVGVGVYISGRVARLRSPTEQGRHWGQLVIGPVFWPGLFALWRARALRRKRAAERHGGPPRVDGVFD